MKMTLTTKEILEGDKIITEFHKGFKFSKRKNEYVIDDGENGIRFFNWLDEFNYHEDWNKIMPVIQKINGDQHKIKNCAINLDVHRVFVHTPYKILESLELNNYGDYKEVVFIAVIKFIKWYNEQTNTK